MKPLKLTMTAFGPFADTQVVDFEAIDQGLFLLTGPTGSGKTTIFDALKYALYGETSGGVREGKDMRCTQADPDVSTSVELIFSHNGNRYRAFRKPAQRRLSKRRNADGELYYMEDKEKVELENLTSGVSLASKDREMEREVEELLGISSKQFGDICMIAQGEFAKVLQASSDDRKKIFSRVFNTGRFASAQIALKVHAAEIKKTLDIEAQGLINVISTIQVVETSASYGLAQNLLSQTNVQYKTSELGELLDAVIAEDAAIKGEAEAARAAVRAQMAQLDGELGAATERQKRRESLADACAWIEANEGRVAQLEARAAEFAASADERTTQATEIEQLRQSLKDYDEYDEACVACDRARRAGEKAQFAADEAQQKKAGFEQKLEQVKATLKGLSGLDVQQAETKNVLAGVDIELGNLKALGRKDREWRAAKSEQKRAQDAYQQAAEKQQAASLAYEKAFAAYNADIAGALADQLRSGELAACPVCGSLEHPHLAEQQQGAPTKDEVAALKAAAEASRAALEEAAGEAGNKNGALEAACAALLEDAARLLQVAEADDVAGALAARQQELQDQRGKLDAALKDIQSKLVTRAKLEDAIPACEEAIEKSEKAIEAAQNQQVKAQNEQAAAAAQAVAVQKRLTFGSRAEADKALKAKKATYDREVAAARAAEQAAQKAKSELEAKCATRDADREALADAPTDDLDALNAQKDALAAQLGTADAALHEVSVRLDRNELAKKSIARAQKNMGLLEEQYAIVHPLAELANGNQAGSAGKVDFETYVQSVYFDLVLRAATERLQIMSGGRYSLVRRTEQKDNKSRTGLDLDVHDRSNDSRRAASTLSGGESFLASLSLALGFSDVVQQQAGGIHVETLFIDEGFGTLDDDTCRTALEVLDKLSGDERLIGVISHVSQLKERIARKVEVEKLDSGSRIHMNLD